MISSLLLLVGCQDPAPIGGQSGTEGPTGCTESGRSSVSDSAAPAGGMGFSVDAVRGALGGQWVGDFSPPAQGESGFTLDLALYADQAEAVGFTALGGGDCPPRYEIPALAEIELGGALDASVPVLLTVAEVDLASGAGTVAFEVVGGSLEPSFDPPAWPIVDLSVTLSFDGGSGRADLSFTGTSDPDSEPTATGVASESIGGADLVRP